MPFWNRNRNRNKKVKEPELEPVDPTLAEQIAGLEGNDAQVAGNFLDENHGHIAGMEDTVGDTIDLGEGTLDTLKAQGDRIDQLADDLRQVRINNGTNQTLLQKLSCCFSCCGSSAVAVDDLELQARQPRGRRPAEPAEPAETGDAPADGVLGRKLRRNEDGLARVGAGVDRLGDIAEDMGDELDRQNHNLDLINAEADRAGDELRKNNDRARKKLGK